MNALIKSERKKRLENRLEKIESGFPFKASLKKQIRSLVDLYIAYLRVNHKKWPYLSEIDSITLNIKAKKNLLSIVTSLTLVDLRVQGALDCLRRGEIEEATQILEDYFSEKDQIISEMQRSNRKGAIKKSEYKELVKEIFRRNPTISAKNMVRELGKEIGKGVIQSINHNSNEIITTKREVFKISGLKDYIHKLRKSEV